MAQKVLITNSPRYIQSYITKKYINQKVLDFGKTEPCALTKMKVPAN